MTNEEIVKAKLAKVAVSPLHFNTTGFYNFLHKILLDELDNMKKAKSIEMRVYYIISASRYSTTYKGNRFQCRYNARRSVQDIYRIYKYYFGDVDIFAIMRALYKITHNKIRTPKEISTYRCSYVKKQVFWINDNDNYCDDSEKADLGVPLKEWKDIGL